MSTRKLLIVASFCTMALSCNLFSQITLEGVVTDNGAQFLGNGAEPVANALVELTDQSDPGRHFSDVTDSEGKYEIQITETGINDSPGKSPNVFTLFQNYPNPFNPSTVIAYEIPQPSHIRIQVFNIIGQKIKTLFDGFQSQLSGSIIWDATDDAGRGVPAGVYMYSLESSGIKVTRKMLLIDGGQNGSISNLSGKVQTGDSLQKSMSNQYQLRVSGNDIETNGQNLEVTGNTVLDVTVNRTVTDIDGNVYKTVKIGDQWWMAENLKVAHYRNGDTIFKATDNTDWYPRTFAGAYCAYDNNENNAAIYGYLYNLYSINDDRKIAPKGWHVPSNGEFLTLVNYLGGEAGGKMKESGYAHWCSPNAGATNESGFNGLPGGFRYWEGDFDFISSTAQFWTSTWTSYDINIVWQLDSYYSFAASTGSVGHYGHSIRLVRD